jgi:hypothetical protein
VDITLENRLWIQDAVKAHQDLYVQVPERGTLGSDEFKSRDECLALKKHPGRHGSDYDLHAWARTKQRWVVYFSDDIPIGVYAYGPQPLPEEIPYFKHARNHWDVNIHEVITLSLLSSTTLSASDLL